MKKLILRMLLITTTLPPHLFAVPTQKVPKQNQRKKTKGDIKFDFHDEDLVDVINMLAEKKRVNIVFPTGANAIKQKITYSEGELLTLDEAWDRLYTILDDIAGYSLIQKGDLYMIVKNSKNISREPLPIFVNTPIREIPNTDERIIYVYYLTNIKASQEFDNQLGALFRELLPDDALYKADKNTNGILVAAKARDIRSVMEIVDAMDQIGFQERLELITLRYTTADTVARIFNEGILKTAASTPNNRFRAGPQGDQAAATYFSQNVRVIPEPRTNALIVLGRVQAVERVKDFIFKYIDIQLDSGNSILHVYDLLYLDAEEFAPILQKIIESTRSGGTEQSRGGEGPQQAGTERFFDQVIVRPDSPAKASDEGSEGKYFGGNKLVIAARHDDWVKIRLLIEKLDKPQPQVIVEVLIADLTLTDARNLGAITRNPADIPLPGNSSIQTAMIDQVVLDSADPAVINTLRGVNSDLNAVTVLPNGATSGPPFVSIPQNLAAGTGVISISDADGRTWSILEVLQQFNPVRILTHPHVIATNNQTATIDVGETRLIVDQAAPSTSGITVRKKNLTANTTVKITPRISSANTVNLQVVININQFLNPTDFSNGDRLNRDLISNASVKSGDILALGGLVSDETDDALLQTPILANIPILGWLFKQKAKTKIKTSLHIFITSTILQPKLRGGVGAYTRTTADSGKKYSLDTAIFDNLRDPITRWFFYDQNNTAVVIDSFLEKDATQDLSHPESEFHNIEREDELLNDTLMYNKNAILQDLLSYEGNPLQRAAGKHELTDALQEALPAQSSGHVIPAKTVAQTKSEVTQPSPAKPAPKKAAVPKAKQKKSNIVPAEPPTKALKPEPQNKEPMHISPPRTQQPCPMPAKKTTAAKPAAQPRTAKTSATAIKPIEKPKIIIAAPAEPKKWPPRQAKQDLKNFLAREGNPLQAEAPKSPAESTVS